MMIDPGEKFLNGLRDEASKKCGDFNAQNLANTLWAFGTLGHNPGEELLRQLAAAADSQLASFSSQNISNTAMAFAKLDFHPGPLMDHICRATLSNLGNFTPQALSNTLWAFSKLDEKNMELLNAVAYQTRIKIKTFNAQNVANTVWAYANIGISPGAEVLDVIAEHARSDMPSYSAQNVSNTLWAFAKLNYNRPSFMECAMAHVLGTLLDFSPQSVANTLWACATLAYSLPPQACQRLADHCKAKLTGFSPQNISNTVWAFATLNHHPVELFTAVAGEVRLRFMGPQGTAFSRQHLANTVWAYATVEYGGGQVTNGTFKAFLNALARALTQRAGDCNPQELSNVCWAFARLRHYDSELMVRMAAEAEAQISDFSQQNLANLAWAFGKISHYDRSLMDAVAKQATVKVKELSLQHMSNILWSFASFLHLPPATISVLLKELRSRLGKEDFNVQQLSNLLWSLCICQICEEDIWKAIMEQFGRLISASAGNPALALPEEAHTQIYQSYLLMQVDQPHVQLTAPLGLLEKARKQWTASCLKVRISQLHNDVADVLHRAGIPFAMEHLTSDKMFSIDIAITGEMIGIEVDGPHHFTVNTNQPLGEMLARQKLLEARGWAMISIPYFKWADQTAEHRTDYLLQEINAARQQQYARAQGNRATA